MLATRTDQQQSDRVYVKDALNPHTPVEFVALMSRGGKAWIHVGSGPTIMVVMVEDPEELRLVAAMLVRLADAVKR